MRLIKSKAFIHLFNEFTPVLAFFVAVQVTDFFTATAIFMVVTVIALTTGWYLDRRFPLFPIIAGSFVLIGGGITLYFDTPDGIILADSIYYLGLGLLVWLSLILDKNILKIIFGHTFAITDRGWTILAHRWIMIFLIAGIANEVARHFLTPEAWANFKVLKVITVGLFGFYQFTVSRRHRLPEESNEWGLRI